jgi:hypothetical protein
METIFGTVFSVMVALWIIDILFFDGVIFDKIVEKIQKW